MDFIFAEDVAIEVKATSNVTPGDLKGLKAIAEEDRMRRYVCVSLERHIRTVGDITVLPYTDFFTALWAGEFG